MNEGGMDRDAQAEQAHTLTASSRPRLSQEHLPGRLRPASSQSSENLGNLAKNF